MTTTAAYSRHVTSTTRSRPTPTIPYSPTDLFSRIPTEIWSTIFHFAVTDANDDTSVYPGMFPLTLSHVCKRWRSIVLDTGNMWTNITLTFPSSPTQLSRAATWAKRSGNYGLDLLLDFRDPNWDWEEDSQPSGDQDIRDVMRILLPYVNRWRTFDLLTDTWLPIHTFLQIFSTLEGDFVLCKLEKIGLQRCNAYFASKNEVFEPAELKAPLKLFSDATSFPVLQNVTLVGVHVDWAGSMRCFSSLTTLEFKYHAREVMPSLREFVQIMQACASSLKHLTILGWGARDTEPDEGDYTKISFAQLESLTFGFLDIQYAQNLLNLFKFPSLRYLALEDISKGVDYTEILDAEPLLTWLVSQSCTHDDDGDECPCTFQLGDLVHLMLRGVRSGKAVFHDFLGRMRKVRHLDISSMPDQSQSVIDALVEPTSCPRLTKVSFKGSYQECSRLCELVTKRAFSQDFQSKIGEVTIKVEYGDEHRNDHDKEICGGMLDFLVLCGVNVFVYD